MIILNEMQPIGSGDDRVVYRHPTEQDRCIKIARVDFKHEFKPIGFNKKLYWVSRAGQNKYFDFNYVDVDYAEFLKKRNSADTFAHIPFCYGYVDTDLGRGVAWEYIAEPDGSPCKSLRDYTDKPEMLGEKQKRLIWRGLEDFFSWQLDQLVLLREIAKTNTLVQEQEDGTFKLYHIDAIGCADLIPLAKHSKFVAKLRIKSKLERFRKIMVGWLGNPP